MRTGFLKQYSWRSIAHCNPMSNQSIGCLGLFLHAGEACDTMVRPSRILLFAALYNTCLQLLRGYVPYHTRKHGRKPSGQTKLTTVPSVRALALDLLPKIQYVTYTAKHHCVRVRVHQSECDFLCNFAPYLGCCGVKYVVTDDELNYFVNTNSSVMRCVVFFVNNIIIM